MNIKGIKRKNNKQDFLGVKQYNFHVPLRPCQIFRADPESRGRMNFRPKVVHLPKMVQQPQTRFLWGKQYVYLPLGPFHCAKFQNMPWSGSRIISMHHYRAQVVHLPQTFFRKKHKNNFRVLLGLSIVQNKKNPLSKPRIMRIRHSKAKNDLASFPIFFFFFFFQIPINPLLNLVPFIHTYLYSENRSPMTKQ